MRHDLVQKIEQTTASGEVVIDGGFLLHKVRWKNGVTYQEVVNIYRNYVQQDYGPCSIIFYGKTGGVTKDQEHQRRISDKKTSENIEVKETNIAHNDQEPFLTNESNKSHFLSLLAEDLRQSGNKVVVCDEDADTKIAEVAVEIAKQHKIVSVMCDDTDVFVILIYHYDAEVMSDIIYKSEEAKKSWSVGKIVSNIGPVVQ